MIVVQDPADTRTIVQDHLARRRRPFGLRLGNGQRCCDRDVRGSLGHGKPWECGPPSEEVPGLDEQDQEVLSRVVAQAIEHSPSCGKGHGGLDRWAEKILHPRRDPLAVLETVVRASCQTGPGYDRLPERRFEFVPLWGIAVCFVYALRRVDCPSCGVTVERVPWARGKYSGPKKLDHERESNPW